MIIPYKLNFGTWEAREYRIFERVEDGIHIGPVAWTACNNKQRTSKALRNAQLIAAAPDLFYTLHSTAEWVQHWRHFVKANTMPTEESMTEILGDISAALSKAASL